MRLRDRGPYLSEPPAAITTCIGMCACARSACGMRVLPKLRLALIARNKVSKWLAKIWRPRAPRTPVPDPANVNEPGQEMSELRDALDDAVRRAYTSGTDGRIPATTDVLLSPGRMRHLERIQRAAWDCVRERVAEGGS